MIPATGIIIILLVFSVLGILCSFFKMFYIVIIDFVLINVILIKNADLSSAPFIKG